MPGSSDTVSFERATILGNSRQGEAGFGGNPPLLNELMNPMMVFSRIRHGK